MKNFKLNYNSVQKSREEINFKKYKEELRFTKNSLEFDKIQDVQQKRALIFLKACISLHELYR